MTSDRKLDTAIEMCLPTETRRRLEMLMAVPSDAFVALVRAAGLDPKSSFRGKKLRINFGDADLNGFDFSGADLSGCDLSRVKLDGAILKGARWGNRQRSMELQGHKSKVNIVAFSPDGRRIASGGDDCTVRLWDAITGVAQLQPTRRGSNRVTCLAFSPDGSRIVSGFDHGLLRVFDAGSGATVGAPMRGHSSEVFSAMFSPDGSRIVSGGRDGTLRFWDATNCIAIGEPSQGSENGVYSVAFSPDGNRIVSGGLDSSLHLWDGATGAALVEPMRGHEGQVNSVAFSPDGSCIASGSDDATLRLWNAATSMAMLKPISGMGDWVNSVAFSPDGNSILSGGKDGTVRVWETATGAALGEPLRGHLGAVHSVAFSPDGCRIVSGGEDGNVIVWFLDPPVHQVFVTNLVEDQVYTRNLLNKLFAHPEVIRRNVVEAVLDPHTHPRPDEGARNALENSVAALFIVRDKDLAFIRKGEVELARRLQRKTGRPRIIPIFIDGDMAMEVPIELRTSAFIHMPLEKPSAFTALIEAICQAIDNPSLILGREHEADRNQDERHQSNAEGAYSTAKTQSRSARMQRIKISRDGQE